MFIKFITSTVHVYIRVSINVLGLLAVWSAKLHCMYIYIYRERERERERSKLA